MPNGLHVDCANDPYDLRPVWDVLLAELGRRWPRATPENPVIILMGEDHSAMPHMLVQQGIMARLRQMSPGCALFAFGFEGEHNMLETMAEDYLDMDIPEGLRGRVSERDPDGVHLLRLYRRFEQSRYAPVTRANGIELCLQKSISTRFNDAAIVPGDSAEFLDADDLSTRDIIHRYRPDIPGQDMKTIDVVGPDGLALRNHMIVERALTHCRDNNVAIYVQQCGQAHMLGDRGCLSFDKGLSSLFLERSADVLPVFIQSRGGACLEQQGKDLLRDRGMIVENLTSARAPRTGRNRMEVEKELLEKISRRSGAEIEVFHKTHEDWNVLAGDVANLLRGALRP